MIPRVSVFTATYNRASTLPDVYESLCAQTFTDFEWIIVDDGSADETEALVAGWQAERRLPLVYVKQENGGKHRAFNHGVRLARGELFINLDSDDTCLPHAVERFVALWDSIPEVDRAGFCGVTVRCVDTNGQFLGGAWPADVLDTDSWQMRHRYKLTGERWGCLTVRALREFPFPEFEGERFVPEGLVWLSMAQKYRTRYVNEGLRVYRPLATGLAAGYANLRRKNPRAMDAYYGFLLEHRAPWGAQVAAVANLVRTRSASGSPVVGILKHRPSWLALLPGLVVGWVYAWRDGRG